MQSKKQLFHLLLVLSPLILSVGYTVVGIIFHLGITGALCILYLIVWGVAIHYWDKWYKKD